jgi:hypothetical protein
MSDWSPLGFENDADFHGLVDGVPPWLEQSFWDWMRNRFTNRVSANGIYGANTRYVSLFNVTELRRIERRLKIAVPYTGTDLDQGVAWVKGVAGHEPGRDLRIADYFLSEGAPTADLETMLSEAGSLWTVGERLGKPGLVQRLPEGVRVAGESVMASSGHAGERLAKAWTAAFGIEPDPSKAYSLAIKAIEDAMKPQISPNDASATLGKMIGKIRADGDWSLPFAREDDRATSASVLLGQLQMLWSGQADRHGGDPDPDLAITQAAAEAAVVFAVPVVQAFSSGMARRTS